MLRSHAQVGLESAAADFVSLPSHEQEIVNTLTAGLSLDSIGVRLQETLCRNTIERNIDLA